MKKRLSNKLIFGLAILCFAVVAFFWFSISAVFLDEAGIDLTQPPSVSTSSETVKTAHTIFVTASNEILIDNKVINYEDLQSTLKSGTFANEKQRVILRINTDARHSILVEIKDVLDELGYEANVEFIRTTDDDKR